MLTYWERMTTSTTSDYRPSLTMETGNLPPSTNDNHALSAASPTKFTHKPLNYCAPSICLVRVRAAKSSDGSIQCVLRHASTTSTYICLSYVWSEDDSDQSILINDQRFPIRQNLYSFLGVARQQRQWRSRWFWIDAICIDQSNAIERNHQVEQMGDIFSRAVTVVAWLGMNEKIADFLQTSRMLREREKAAEKVLRKWGNRVGVTEENESVVLNPSDVKEVFHDGGTTVTGANADGFRHFCEANYWDRAWITQEVALASHIMFMAGKTVLTAKSMSLNYDHNRRFRVDSLDPRTTQQLRGRSLIYLMHRFKSKKSVVKRDRIFSLLSLCGDGSDVLVDYDSTDLQVAENVLRCCKRSFCLCAIDIVAFVLRVHTELLTSQYILNSRLDFAHITLPVTTDPSLYSDHFNDHETAIFVLYESNRYGSVFTLDVSSLCRSHHGRLRVSVDHAWTTSSICYIDWSLVGGGFHDENEIHIFDGCRIRLSSDQESCTAMFSLEFLYQIIQLNRSYGQSCCERVEYEGTTSRRPSDWPSLVLCGRGL